MQNVSRDNYVGRCNDRYGSLNTFAWITNGNLNEKIEQVHFYISLLKLEIVIVVFSLLTKLLNIKMVFDFCNKNAYVLQSIISI